MIRSTPFARGFGQPISSKYSFGDTRSEEGASRRIFVFGISIRTTVDDFKEFFGPAENIEGVSIVPGQWYAFVQFTRPSFMTNALSKDQYLFLGQKISVSMYTARKNQLSKRPRPPSISPEPQVDSPGKSMEYLDHDDKRTKHRSSSHSRDRDEHKPIKLSKGDYRSPIDDHREHRKFSDHSEEPRVIESKSKDPWGLNSDDSDHRLFWTKSEDLHKSASKSSDDRLRSESKSSDHRRSESRSTSDHRRSESRSTSDHRRSESKISDRRRSESRSTSDPRRSESKSLEHRRSETERSDRNSESKFRDYRSSETKSSEIHRSESKSDKHHHHQGSRSNNSDYLKSQGKNVELSYKPPVAIASTTSQLPPSQCMLETPPLDLVTVKTDNFFAEQRTPVLPIPEDVQLYLKMAISRNTATDLTMVETKKILDYFTQSQTIIQRRIMHQVALSQAPVSPIKTPLSVPPVSTPPLPSPTPPMPPVRSVKVPAPRPPAPVTTASSPPPSSRLYSDDKKLSEEKRVQNGLNGSRDDYERQLALDTASFRAKCRATLKPRRI